MFSLCTRFKIEMRKVGKKKKKAKGKQTGCSDSDAAASSPIEDSQKVSEIPTAF